MLTARDVAEMLGVKVTTVYVYRHRGTLPPPDGYLGRTPWWAPETISAWLTARRLP